MTISTPSTPLSYSGNGSVVAFAITWAYKNKSHVVATLRDSSGVETVQVLTTNYTLTDPGDSGTLTMNVAPASGETLVITLEPPNTQEKDIPLGGNFPAKTVEDGLDLLTQIAQKVQSLFNRAIRVPKTDTQTDDDLELPIDSERASKFLAFDSNGKAIASTGPTGDSSIPVSSFIETLLDDTTAAAARTTLGAAADEDAVLTGKVSNYGLTFSVNASALTVALKTIAGTDASASDKILAGFRSSTLTDGTYVVRTVSAALSLVISSDSTLGHTSARAEKTHWYLIDNAGTVELAVSSKYFGRSGIVTTTAEGGVGGADSATVMYSTTGRTDVAFIWIAETIDTQTTAGAWAAVPTSARLDHTDTEATTEVKGQQFLPKNWISGCDITAGGGDDDMDIAAGQVVDSTGEVMFNIAALTKNLTTWVLGDSAGGLDTGSAASSTSYHIYAIYRSDTGVSDYLFSASASSPTLPSNYTHFRRIGSWRTDGSSEWFKGYSRGKDFYLDASVLDIDVSNPGNTAVTRTLTSVPTGVKMKWIGLIGFHANSNRPHLLLSQLAKSDEAAGNSNATIIAAPQTAFVIYTSQHSPRIETNTSAQIRSRCDGADANTGIRLRTLGWEDERVD